MVVELLHRIVNVLQLYFGAKLRESAVQENFATVYQVGPGLACRHAWSRRRELTRRAGCSSNALASTAVGGDARQRVPAHH